MTWLSFSNSDFVRNTSVWNLMHDISNIRKKTITSTAKVYWLQVSSTPSIFLKCWNKNKEYSCTYSFRYILYFTNQIVYVNIVNFVWKYRFHDMLFIDIYKNKFRCKIRRAQACTTGPACKGIKFRDIRREWLPCYIDLPFCWGPSWPWSHVSWI